MDANNKARIFNPISLVAPKTGDRTLLLDYRERSLVRDPGLTGRSTIQPLSLPPSPGSPSLKTGRSGVFPQEKSCVIFLRLKRRPRTIRNAWQARQQGASSINFSNSRDARGRQYRAVVDFGSSRAHSFCSPMAERVSRLREGRWPPPPADRCVHLHRTDLDKRRVGLWLLPTIVPTWLYPSTRTDIPLLNVPPASPAFAIFGKNHRQTPVRSLAIA